MRKFIKLLLTFSSIAIFVSAIINEVDGIGRFAMILFGTVFAIVGSFLQWTRPTQCAC